MAGRIPATTAPAHTSVGMTAIRRFLRPVAFQNAPAHVLPPELQDANPLGIWRRVDGELTRERARSVVHDAHGDARRARGVAERQEVAHRGGVLAERAAERIGRRRRAGGERDRGVAARAGERPAGQVPGARDEAVGPRPPRRVTGSGRVGSEPSKSRWKDTPRV